MRLVTDLMKEMWPVFTKIPPEYAISKEEPVYIKAVIRINDSIGIPIPMDFGSWKDLAATLEVGRDSETIILPGDMATSFLDMAKNNRVEMINRLHIPFDHIFVQFDELMEEEEFFTKKERNGEWQYVIEKDFIRGVFICRDNFPDSDKWLNTAICWFEPSHAANRVAWWDDGTYNMDDADQITDNKIRLRQFATAVAMFLTSKNVQIKMRRPDSHVNERRRRKGKRELPEYYETVITKTYYDTVLKGEGGVTSKHSYMYPVRGHFRHFRNGDRIWIGPHYRGIANADRPKHAYRVKS